MLDSKSKVNIISLAFTYYLSFIIWRTNVGVQKINGTTLETYKMVVFTFSMLDKDDRERFFKENFLLADVKPDIVLGMPFLTISNIDVDFQAWNLQWRSYTTGNVFSTTKQVKLIEKKEFAAAALDPKHKTFVVYVAAFSIDSGDELHSLKKAQIAHLKADKASIKVLSKYANFADIFSSKLAVKLSEHMKINNHAIELVDDWQPSYGLIYSLGLVELKTLKVYIKNNLDNSFIKSFKSLAKASIFFNKKPNGSLRLCVDYQGLNNLAIKNCYPLPLVGELLDWLDWAQRFIQLDFTNVYHQMKIKEGNKWKMVFRTYYGYFKYQVMSFRLTNAPAIFQGYINKTLVEKLNLFVIIYLDDIFI